MYLNSEEQFLICGMQMLCLQEDPDNLPFTTEELKNCLHNLTNLAPGKDEIHNEMLKYCHPEMLTKILDLFNDV